MQDTKKYKVNPHRNAQYDQEIIDTEHRIIATVRELGNHPKDMQESETRAKLIAQALNVKESTGLTPRELKQKLAELHRNHLTVCSKRDELTDDCVEYKDQNEKMREALEQASKKIEVIINATPTGDNRNSLTEVNISILQSLTSK